MSKRRLPYFLGLQWLPPIFFSKRPLHRFRSLVLLGLQSLLRPLFIGIGCLIFIAIITCLPARVLARQHQFTEAIALLRALLDRNPSDRSLAKQLGLALSWYGDDSAAVARLAPLYRADPTDREVGLALARIHFRHGEIRPALVIVSHLLPFFPENVELLTEAAFLEAHLGHAATAMTYFRRAEKNSADPEAVRLAFAEQISAWGDFYLIEQIYRDRLKRHPGDMVTYRKLANVLTAEQRYDEAESIHRQLLLQNPSATSALFSIAAVRAEAKDYVAARAWVDRFLDGEPITTEYPGWLWHLCPPPYRHP